MNQCMTERILKPPKIPDIAIVVLLLEGIERQVDLGKEDLDVSVAEVVQIEVKKQLALETAGTLFHPNVC